MYSLKQIDAISTHRDAIYGISIILIILYHCSCGGDNVFFIPFEKGFIGVDIFMMMSGFGLCHSYTKRSLKDFYLKRVLRIIPAYVLYNIFFVLVSTYYFNTPISFEDFFYNLTTLSFYGFGSWGIGNKCFDWFTAAILLLYMIFPILYRLARKWGMFTFFFVSLFAMIYNHFFVVPWRIDCLVSRVPIFFFGILLFIHREKLSLVSLNKESGIGRIGRILLFLPAFIYVGYIYSTNFFLTAMITPFFLLIVCGLMSLLAGTFVYRCLSYLGKYSYELFLANSWSQQWSVFVLQIFPLNIISVIFYHLVAQHIFIIVTRSVRNLVKMPVKITC